MPRPNPQIVRNHLGRGMPRPYGNGHNDLHRVGMTARDVNETYTGFDFYANYSKFILSKADKTPGGSGIIPLILKDES